MKITNPIKLLSIWLMTILLAIMATSFIVSANQEEIIVKEVEYIVMDQQEYEEVYENENELQSELVSLGKFKVTAYCPCSKCCGVYADGITYSGEKAVEGVTIAADLSVLPIGTRVRIEGVGERIVQDKGGAIKGNKLDLFFYNHGAALQFGVQELEVEIVE